MHNNSTLSWIFCSHNFYLIVFDIHGNRVNNLCGKINYEKYLEIERRSKKEITIFEGLDRLRCIACELKKNVNDGNKDWG